MATLDLGGYSVNVRDVGKGPPVILLHCSCSHSGQWKPLANAISDRYRVLAPDFLGYGLSDPLPRDDKPYFVHDTAIVSALLDAVDAPAHVVGHSLGGTIAARVALDRPDDVASLTLIEPVLFNLLEESRDPHRIEHLEVANAMTVLIRFGEREHAARLFLDFWIGPDALDAMDRETREYTIRTIDRVVDDWHGISSYAPGALTLSDFRRLSSRTLLLCGGKTRRSAHRISNMLNEVIPDTIYRELEQAAHMAPITHAEDVNEVIVEFIDR